MPSIQYFSSRGGWLWANDVSVPRKVTQGPGEHILGLFGLYSSSLSKSVGFVSLSGKASLVSISAAILFLRSWTVYFPLEFEFRGKSYVE